MKNAFSTFAALLLASGVAVAGDAAVASHAATVDHTVHTQTASAQPPDEFAALDTNHDGVLSKAEMSRYAKAGHMAMVDENQDGVLSRDEFAELKDM